MVWVVKIATLSCKLCGLLKTTDIRRSNCWAQSVDLRNPWIALCNLWIHTLRRNPWIAQESVDRAGRSMHFGYDTIQLVQTYLDGLVISTNLKLNNFMHFNGLNGPL